MTLMAVTFLINILTIFGTLSRVELRPTKSLLVHQGDQDNRRKWERGINCLRFVPSSGLPFLKTDPNSSGVRKFMEYSSAEANCETEMAHLDNYAIVLQNNPDLRALVMTYGGRRNTARDEMKKRRSRIKRYLTKTRAIDSERVLVIAGGFRENLTIELWLVPAGERLPKPKPTISMKDVKYKKPKYSFDCSSFY